MATKDELLRAIRGGQLAAVRQALDDGAPVEITDGSSAPGMPLGIACFLGHGDIVRELVGRGASVNLTDNRDPVSPLSLAVRGRHPGIVRLLIELGATVPAGLQTGLAPEEIAAAQWLATRGGDFEVEEIVMTRAIGTDTIALEADAIQRAIAMETEKQRR